MEPNISRKYTLRGVGASRMLWLVQILVASSVTTAFHAFAPATFHGTTTSTRVPDACHRDTVPSKSFIAGTGIQSTTPLFLARKKQSVPEFSVVEEMDDDEEDDDEEEGDVVATMFEVEGEEEDDDDDDVDVDDEESLEHREEQQVGVAVSGDEQIEEVVANKKDEKIKYQFAALEPGTVVQIQMGDWNQSRKAWKKRRRSGSPLLVPCSVLNVDRSSTVRWNLIYLLEKFGDYVGSKNRANGIRLSLSQLMRRHRSHLKSSLLEHAVALGYESCEDLVKSLFTKQVQDTYGVKLIESEASEAKKDDEDESTLWLEAPSTLTRMKAQKRAKKAAVLQFADLPPKESTTTTTTSAAASAGLEQDSSTLEHTGIVRIRLDNNNSRDDNRRRYKLLPLSAALRVHQEDIETHQHIETGSIHPAVVFDFDPEGDAGSPLLTLSLNPSRNQVRERLKLDTKTSGLSNKNEAIDNPKYVLDKLAVGDGPIPGKVVHFVKGGAIIDCDVGRKQQQDEKVFVKVFGKLNFKDAVTTTTGTGAAASFKEDYDDDDDDVAWVYEGDDEDEEDDDEVDEIDNASIDTLFSQLDVNDEEDDDDDDDDDANTQDEDITHLFKLNDDGSLSYEDPETGETAEIFNMDDDDDDEDTDALEGSRGFAKTNKPAARSASRQREPLKEKGSSFAGPYKKSHRLQVGDRIDVYVKSVAKQSSRLELTMDVTAVQGKSAKDLKNEHAVLKKLERLEKQLGGDINNAMRRLQGQECDGIVQATSQTGDWYYVQPQSADDEHGGQLPVGVAIVVSETIEDESTTMTVDDDDDDDSVEQQPPQQQQLNKGDRVRIRIDGIDGTRGQLAMSVLRKLD